MDERTAGIVLAGGRSRRMGTPKATLEWHGSTLLHRAAGLVARAVGGPVVVVRAAGQQLPPLPAGVERTEDARDDRGPLQGIAAGLAHVGDRATVVFVTGVDAPLLHPALIRCVLRALRDEDDVALPHAGGFAQPLAAAYRIATTTPRLHALLEHDASLGTGALLATLRVRDLDEATLLADPAIAAHDPDLRSLVNLNEPGQYEAARARPAPTITVHTQQDGPRQIRAATLAAAATAAGITIGPGVEATLDGHGVIADPHEPLVAGDALTFSSRATFSAFRCP